MARLRWIEPRHPALPKSHAAMRAREDNLVKSVGAAALRSRKECGAPPGKTNSVSNALALHCGSPRTCSSRVTVSPSARSAGSSAMRASTSTEYGTTALISVRLDAATSAAPGASSAGQSSAARRASTRRGKKERRRTRLAASSRGGKCLISQASCATSSPTWPLRPPPSLARSTRSVYADAKERPVAAATAGAAAARCCAPPRRAPRRAAVRPPPLPNRVQIVQKNTNPTYHTERELCFMTGLLVHLWRT